MCALFLVSDLLCSLQKTKILGRRARAASNNALTEARKTFSKSSSSTVPSTDWKSQIEPLLQKIRDLKNHQHILSHHENPKEQFDYWYQLAQEAIAKKVHDHWPILVQYGVRELLYFFCKSWLKLLEEEQGGKAIIVLVRVTGFCSQWTSLPTLTTALLCY